MCIRVHSKCLCYVLHLTGAVRVVVVCMLYVSDVRCFYMHAFVGSFPRVPAGACRADDLQRKVVFSMHAALIACMQLVVLCANIV